MVFNIKYYIISIASIFIALGIGIVIGFNMNGDQLYLNQQQILIESLENRFIEFRVENQNLLKEIEDLSLQNDKNSLLISTIRDDFLTDLLKDMNFVLIQTTEHYYYNNIISLLEIAGANVPIHIIYTDKLLGLPEESKKQIQNEYNLFQYGNIDLIQVINTHIVDLVSTGYISDLLEFCINHSYILAPALSQNLESYMIDEVIIAGGNLYKSSEKLNLIDIPLISKIKGNNLSITGVERYDVAFSYIPFYKKFNISTIDNINTKIGEISLVYVLMGKKGHFGQKNY